MRKAYLKDCLSWFFCGSCALIQEHRFINRAFQAYKENKRFFEIVPIPLSSEKAEPPIPGFPEQEPLPPSPGDQNGRAATSSQMRDNTLKV
jgi:hypothetical protein